MKNLLIFYLLILVPIGIIIWLSKAAILQGSLLWISIVFYVFVYRTYTDGKRLSDKNIIEKKDIWHLIIPGKRIEHFKELYLKS